MFVLYSLKYVVPSAPKVTVIGEGVAVVIWEPPEMSTGVILNYELKFTGKGEQTTVLVDGEVLHYIPSLTDIPQNNNGTITVQVRYMKLIHTLNEGWLC